jgi:hypothetical protein
MTAKAIQGSATSGVPAHPPTRFGRNATAQASNKQTPRGPAPPPTKFGAVAKVQTIPATRLGVRPSLPGTRDATVQLANRKGVAGGGGGLTYGDVGNVSQDRKNEIMAEAGLTKVKGHTKGARGSGVSRQTQDETAKFVDAKHKIEAREAKQKKCDTYHANKRNVGRRCPECREIVEEQ